ncbi:hypothetical protein [Primorskyibacter sp. S187A]|uniref:hypothetical protein n=1 Tax=Primorskyibacter sp. S187A TaxID=3415130 RepID=UPI003C7DED30
MLRLPLAVALCAAAFVSPVAANPDCAVFGAIAETAVAERQADAEMMATMVKIAEGFEGNDERFRAAVPAIVEFVWGLPGEQLSADVGAAWQAQCEAM